MGIGKQDFYEGAALVALLRARARLTVNYEPPFFVIDDDLSVYLKYSTKVRSPWGFTFMPAEQAVLHERAANREIVVGLICGADGVASLPIGDYFRIANRSDRAVHVACYRLHGEHFALSGPDGKLDRKIAPSQWTRLGGQTTGGEKRLR